MAGCDGAGSPAPGPHGHPCPLRSRRSVGSSTAADGARSGAWRGGRRQAPVIVPRLGQLDGAACSSRAPRARPARATNFLDGELCAPGGDWRVSAASRSQPSQGFSTRICGDSLRIFLCAKLWWTRPFSHTVHTETKNYKCPATVTTVIVQV